MGVVWVARSSALDVDVALKMLRPELAGTEAVERMAREARTAAQLGHPAMVRVLDFGTSEQGEPFLAMELLQGEDLHTLLERERRLPAERAVALLLPVIDGLATAHEKGIVHRDIKLENVFIARDDQGRIQPKLLDFGIAKLESGKGVSRLTQVGAVLGSPQALSPEQAEGLDDVDFRSDIWSVGVLLYELITGTPPFQGANYNALLRSILKDAPTPTMELAAGDAPLWVIIARCLNKSPAERWNSMWELGEALALWLFERGVRVDAASRSLRDGWLESGVTGLRMLVVSEAPDAATLPPPAVTGLIRDAPASQTLVGGTPTAERSFELTPSPQTRTNSVPSPSHPKRRWLPAAGLAGVASAALLLLYGLRSADPGPRPSSAASPRSPARAATEDSAAAAVPPQVAASVPSPLVPAASAPSEVKAEPSAVAPAASPRPPVSTPVVVTPATRSAPRRKPAPRPSLNTEFGF